LSLTSDRSFPCLHTAQYTFKKADLFGNDVYRLLFVERFDDRSAGFNRRQP
jgi:hypothetical protein